MFSTQEQAEIEALLGEAFDSFKEKIVIYSTPTVAFVASATSDYNFAFGAGQPASAATYVTNSGEFWATVEYVDSESHQHLAYPVDQGPLKQPQGEVRIATSGQAARDMLMNAEKIVLDGIDYRRSTDIIHRGMFSRNYFDCWLTKIDNGEV